MGPLQSSVALGLILLLFGVSPARAMDPTLLAEQMKSASVLILTESEGEEGETQVGAGTGYYISPDLIVTNAHVVDETSNVFVVRGRDITERQKAEVLISDATVDLALLRSPFKSKSYLKAFSSRIPKLGTAVYVYGNPLDTIGTFSTGVLGNVLAQRGMDVIHFTAPIAPGSSGGPIVDSDGVLVGTVSSSLEGPSSQNMNRAIPAKYLVRLLLPLAYRLTDLGFTSKQEKELVGDCSFITPTVPFGFDVAPTKRAAELAQGLRSRTPLLDSAARPPFFYEQTYAERAQVVFGHTPLVGPRFVGKSWNELREWVARDFLASLFKTGSSSWKNFKLKVSGDGGAVKATFSKDDARQLESLSAIYLFPYCKYWVYEQWPKVAGESSSDRKKRKQQLRDLEEWPEGVGEGDLWVESPFFLESSKKLLQFGSPATPRLTAVMRAPVRQKLSFGASLMAAIPLLIWAGARFRKGRQWSGVFLVMLSSGILRQSGGTEVWPLNGFKREEWQSAAEETPVQEHIPPGVIAMVLQQLQDEAENEGNATPDDEGVTEAPDPEASVSPAQSPSNPPVSQGKTYAFKSIEKTESGVYRVTFYAGSGTWQWQHCSPECESFKALYEGHPFQWDETKNEISFVDSLGRRFACRVVPCVYESGYHN